ncbi:MAG TPA: CBS domain-containing protein [Nitrososphaera sp.]|jgi:CBS domain-containing protein
MQQEEYADKRAGDIAKEAILVMDESVCVADAARAMRQKGVSSVLVSRNGSREPVGIVTEREIVYRLVAEHRSPFKTILKDIMSSLR